MIRIEQENKSDNAIHVLNQIPEFDAKFTSRYLKQRLVSDSIILIAYFNGCPAGCKIAYNRFSDGSLYSWLGGVLPDYRNKEIAEKLNTEMESIAKEKGYNSIVFKTRNKFKAMLQFGLKNGYNIVGYKEKDDVFENRIILKKEL